MSRVHSKLKIHHSRFKEQGWVLLELLTATILFSLAGTGLTTGFLQGIKAHQRIGESFKTYDPLRLFFFELDRDLRNSVSLKEFPFQGKKEAIEFPTLRIEETKEDKRERKLLLVRYFLKEDSLLRTQTELTQKLEKEKPKEKILMKNLRSFSFEFPYEDPEENLLSEPFWPEEPYFGIPRGVKVSFTLKKGLSFEKRVSLPQGRVGRIREKGNSEW